MMQNLFSKLSALRSIRIRVVPKACRRLVRLKVHTMPDEKSTVACRILLRAAHQFVAEPDRRASSRLHCPRSSRKRKIGVKRDGHDPAWEIDDLTGSGHLFGLPRTSGIEANQVVNLTPAGLTPAATQLQGPPRPVVFQNKNVMCQYRSGRHPDRTQ